ncbi:hypothetical protein DY218_24920 [Streptomyces triticagri]|uniref:Uncharacterized protein n=1 Tax=Streptomyces triticagri TaxID=2293568 RepID=A0A372M0Y9_9ACTN|nr:hypothetical protein [Streptomyces triticagri]RFU83967.1 hypothetical protein DY218_24920 [Streptomyces triticagri]
MLTRLRRLFQPDGRAPGTPDPEARAGRHTTRPGPNLFEAAAAYVAACAEDDEEAIEAAEHLTSPEALSFGVRELACRALIALAREYDEPPHKVARSLLGLPAA